MAESNDLRYVELKSGYADNGPAWIGFVKTSRSGQTIYFNGHALQKVERGMFQDIESGQLYWISGVKKDGQDRHWAGGGKIQVEAKALQAYLQVTGMNALPSSKYDVAHNIVETDISKFQCLLNQGSDETGDGESL